jgi:diadenosine tetraphosphate (Ap4A) HIT family hydrolase
MAGSTFHENVEERQHLHNLDSIWDLSSIEFNDVMDVSQNNAASITDMDCKLCEILRESKKNETFIARLEFGSLFLHQNQIYSGRCLYVSNVHVDNFPHIDYELFVNLNKEMLSICVILERIFQPDLINFASLGNSIKHFHYHIIPRYRYDSNWGSPPWPAAEKKLTETGYQNVIATIRTSLHSLDGQETDVHLNPY